MSINPWQRIEAGRKDKPTTKKSLTDCERAQLGYQKRQAVRQQLAKKVRHHEKPYTWRLGYNHCIGQFTPRDGEYPLLSGSSLNRRPKPDQLQYYHALETLEEEKPPAVHYLSRRSRGKIKDKTTAFYRAIPRDRIFLTLTFIQHVDDWTGVRILNKFLTVVRKERPGFEYIWIAEHQPDRKEKTIHFHILMNKKLTVRRYNALWVLQQYNAGLTGHRKDGSEISRREILDRYEDGTIQKVLNPLDVRKAYGVQGLAHYLTMYVTKQEKNDPFGCSTWHCSRKVSRLFTRQVVGPSTFAYLNSFVNYSVNRKTGECSPAQVYRQQHFCMVYVNNKKAPLTALRKLELVNKWIIDHFKPDRVTEITDDQYRRLIHGEQNQMGAARSVPT